MFVDWVVMVDDVVVTDFTYSVFFNWRVKYSIYVHLFLGMSCDLCSVLPSILRAQSPNMGAPKCLLTNKFGLTQSAVAFSLT